MKLLKLWRTFKEGFRNYRRNGLLTIATVSVLALSLYVIGFVVARAFMTEELLKQMEEKINISVYFNSDVEKEKILEIKSVLENYPEIKSIKYVSKEEALDEFLKGNEDLIIRQVLQEIGDNPLPPSLVVTAKESHQYEIINANIEQSAFSDKINRINYQKNKEVIAKIGNAINSERKQGIIAGAIFIVIAVLITFNTIRLTMFSHRQEFEIMRLVGASNTYVKMPFIFEGVFYGITATVVSMIMLLITARYNTHSVFFASENTWDFYVKYGFLVFGLLFVFGVSMGITSGYIAIHKYLKK